MPRIPVSRTFAPFLALLGGLALGWIVRDWMPGNDAGPAASAPGSEIPSRARDHADRSPLPTGPTSVLIGRLAGLSEEECTDLALRFMGEPDRELELEAVFVRWLEFERIDAIVARLSETGNRPRFGSHRALFRAWVTVDEPAAMDPATGFDRFIAPRALHAIETGHPSFTDFLDVPNTPIGFDELAQEAMASLARDRPEIARQIARAELRDERLKTRSITAVARGWAMSDPAAALAWLESLGLTGPGDRPSQSPHLPPAARSDLNAHVSAVFVEWLKTDPAAASDARQRLGLMDARRYESSISGRALGAMTDPAKAASQLYLALNRDPFADVATLHRHLSVRDVDWEKQSGVRPAIGHDGWYGVDPAADARAAESLPPGPARDFLMQIVCENWSAHDSEAALRFAERHGIRSSFLDQLRSTPTEDMRRAVLVEPEKNFTSLFDPEAEAPEGVSRDQLEQLATEWTRDDPVVAAEWLIGLQRGHDDPMWDDVFFSNAIGYHWAKNDALGAAQWVEGLPDTFVRAEAWSAMREAMRNYAPDLAFSLSAEWFEGDHRQAGLLRDLKAVAEDIGRPAARALLESTELPAAERTALAEALENPSDSLDP